MMTNFQQPQAQQPLKWSLGKRWLHKSIALFQIVQKQWYAIFMLAVVTVLLVGFISQQFALLLLMLSMPLITAWFYIHCRQRQLHENQGRWQPRQAPLSWPMAWQQLKIRFNPLMILGLLAVIINFILSYLQLALMDMWQLAVLTPELAAQMTLQEGLQRLMINMVTGLPLTILMAFSPALIMFNNDNPFNAMILSVKALITAWKPLFSLTLWLFLLLMAVSFVVALLNAFLAGLFGAAATEIIMLLFLFVAMGFVFTANFVAYDALFPDARDDSDDHDDNQPMYAEI